MAEGDGGAKTFTQEEVDALVSETTAGLKSQQTTLLDEAKKAKTALAAFDGFDLEEFTRLKEAEEVAKRQKALGEGDWKTLEHNQNEAHGKVVEAHGVQLAERDAHIDKLVGALQKHLVDAELTKAISAAKGDAALLLPHARAFVQTRETDEGFEVFVTDEKGTPLVSDGQGTPMTMAQLVEGKLVDEYPRAFEGTGSSGGGASKSSAGGQRIAGTIAADDGGSFMDNLDGIAEGKIQVR